MKCNVTQPALETHERLERVISQVIGVRTVKRPDTWSHKITEWKDRNRLTDEMVGIYELSSSNDGHKIEYRTKNGLTKIYWRDGDLRIMNPANCPWAKDLFIEWTEIFL